MEGKEGIRKTERQEEGKIRENDVLLPSEEMASHRRHCQLCLPHGDAKERVCGER